MTLNAQALENLIRDDLPGCTVTVENLRCDGVTHYAISVISELFIDKSRVQQHRMIYAALKNHINFDEHPLTLHTSVPDA